MNASVNINTQQRQRVAESITRLNVQPLNNVNFSLSVGTAVPRDVRLQTLPSDVVEPDQCLENTLQVAANRVYSDS